MTAKIIDGAAIASAVLSGLRGRVGKLAAHGVHPGLGAVLVGENPASQVHVRNKTLIANTVTAAERLPGVAA